MTADLGWPDTSPRTERYSGGLGWPAVASEPSVEVAPDPAPVPVVVATAAAAPGGPADLPAALPVAGQPVDEAPPLDAEAVSAGAPPGPDAAAPSGLRAELDRLLDDGVDDPGSDGDPELELNADPTEVADAIASAPIARARAALADQPTDVDTPIGEIAAAAVRALNPGGRFDFPKPARRRIITVANQKGGVGKTTSTVNLAAAMALHGLNVLVIDLDPQGNASTGLGVDHHSGIPSVYDVLIDGTPIADVVQLATGVPNLRCVPATIDLAGAEIELVSVVARESRLKRAVDAYCSGAGADLDYVLVDCPPSLGLLTVNAMVATEELLIPIQCEYYALEGLGQLLRNVELVRGHLNPALHVSTILLTMYDARTKLADQVRDEVRGHFGPTVLSTTIPRSVRVSEAPGYGQSVVTYDPGSRGSLAYLDAAREIAERGADPAASQ